MKKSLYLLFSIALLFSFSQIASAHERQVFRIGVKDYLFVVGSLNEPIVVDDKTGVDLRIKIADPLDLGNSSSLNSKAVEGLDQTLKVEISAGDKKQVFDLAPAYKDPGAYRAPYYPTIQTTLNYRVFGTIDSVPVDITFTCNPAGHPASEEDKTSVKISDTVTRKLKAGSFGCPAAKADLGFPEKTASLYDLHVSLASANGTTQTIAIAALAVALLALLIGLSSRPRKK